MKKEKCFEEIYSQELGGKKIILDKETGVQYLYCGDGYGGGLTPLLGADGKPIIAPIENKNS